MTTTTDDGRESTIFEHYVVELSEAREKGYAVSILLTALIDRKMSRIPFDKLLGKAQGMFPGIETEIISRFSGWA